MQIDILAVLKPFYHMWVALSLLNKRVEDMNNNQIIRVEERHGRLRNMVSLSD